MIASSARQSVLLFLLCFILISIGTITQITAGSVERVSKAHQTRTPTVHNNKNKYGTEGVNKNEEEGSQHDKKVYWEAVETSPWEAPLPVSTDTDRQCAAMIKYAESLQKKRDTFKMECLEHGYEMKFCVSQTNFDDIKKLIPATWTALSFAVSNENKAFGWCFLTCIMTLVVSGTWFLILVCLTDDYSTQQKKLRNANDRATSYKKVYDALVVKQKVLDLQKRREFARTYMHLNFEPTLLESTHGALLESLNFYLNVLVPDSKLTEDNKTKKTLLYNKTLEEEEKSHGPFSSEFSSISYPHLNRVLNVRFQEWCSSETNFLASIVSMSSTLPNVITLPLVTASQIVNSLKEKHKNMSSGSGSGSGGSSGSGSTNTEFVNISTQLATQIGDGFAHNLQRINNTLAYIAKSTHMHITVCVDPLELNLAYTSITNLKLCLDRSFEKRQLRAVTHIVVNSVRDTSTDGDATMLSSWIKNTFKITDSTTTCVFFPLRFGTPHCVEEWMSSLTPLYFKTSKSGIDVPESSAIDRKKTESKKFKKTKETKEAKEAKDEKEGKQSDYKSNAHKRQESVLGSVVPSSAASPSPSPSPSPSLSSPSSSSVSASASSSFSSSMHSLTSLSLPAASSASLPAASSASLPAASSASLPAASSASLPASSSASLPASSSASSSSVPTQFRR